jgi:transcriptional regulator with PAS, ATPase and Fis domain
LPTERIPRDLTLALNAASLTPEGTAWLLVEPREGGAGRPVEIGGEPLVLGSAEGCAVQIDDPHVSRRHAEIRRTSDGIVLRDLGSRNGTQVGRITVKEAVLTSGAEIRIGTTNIRFEMGGEMGRLARLAHEPVRDEELAQVSTRFGPAIGASAPMRRVFALLGRLAPTELTITLIGETGTGKDVLAHAVHAASPRAAQPFVIFDCGAVASGLIESELFGHEKGSFTGAVAERQGAFERAQGGTLFLDEIGELNLELQPKLLRVLERRRVRRVGGGTDLPIDVRIVAATNRDLEERVRDGNFRQDLFFRLSVAVLHVPPLRDRRQDIPALAEHLLVESGKSLRISPATMDVLVSHEWPGNVRELRNVLAAAAAMADGPLLEPRHLLFFRGQRRRPATTDSMPLAGQSLEAVEKAAIEQTLRHCDGNKTRAAKALGIAASTLYEKIKKYGLQDGAT